MKATSKLISVVLILALCLSMFTVSAFAANTVITAPSEKSNGNVAVGGYRGSEAGKANPDNQDSAKSGDQVSAEAPAAPVNDGFAEVGSADELQAALDSQTVSIRLTEQIEWAGVLNLDYDVAIDLGGKGKGLVFSGSGDAAIVSSANAELFNGNIFVSGISLAAESEEAAPGFFTVADSVDGGSVYLHGVYVKFTEAGDNGIFGDGIRLGNGTFSQNVAKYYAEGDLEENYVVTDETAEGGMFDVTAKAAAPVVDEGEDEDGDAGEGSEADGDGVTLTGVYGEGTDKIVVTISGENLPEALRVEVKPVDNSVLKVEGEKVLFAVDITIYDAEGNVYEPEEDPNVPEVTVLIRHPALGNVEEGEAVTLYHLTKGEAIPVASAEDLQSADTLEFTTDSFSVYAATKTETNSDGDVHYRVVTADSVEIYVNGSGGLTVTYTGGKDPEAVSFLPYELALSGDYDTYKAYILSYEDPADYTVTEGKSITIDDSALKTAPDGKYGVVLWYMDGNTRVYIVQPVILVNEDGVVGVGDNFTATDEEKLGKEGTFDVEMCDQGSVKVKLTNDFEKFTISGGDCGDVVVNATDKKVTINGKTYAASELYSVEDYYAADPVGHQFVAGKVLTLSQTLIKLLGFHDDNSVEMYVRQKDTEAAGGPFILNISPGITVADGLDDYIKGKNLWVKFQACAPIDYDSDGTLAIWIGGLKISHEYYNISDDHKTLWIYRNLLDQLKSNNRYTLTARLWQNVKDPETGKKVKETYYPATASFNVLAAGSTSSKSPKTGDESNIALWASVLVLSGGAVIALIPKKKKSGVK